MVHAHVSASGTTRQTSTASRPRGGQVASRLLDLGEQAVRSRLQLKEQQKASGCEERKGPNGGKRSMKVKASPMDEERDDFEDAWERLGK